MRVAVLKGGFSSEREVSLVSGKACAHSLKNEGFDVIEIDVLHVLFFWIQYSGCKI